MTPASEPEAIEVTDKSAAHEWIKEQPHGGADAIPYRVVQPDLGEIDTLDDMQPVPTAGRFFAERIFREEVRTSGGEIIVAEGEGADDVAPRRARVVQLSEIPPEGGWPFKVDYHVIVPFHAGETYSWRHPSGIIESLWIVHVNEVLAIFRPKA